MSKTADRPRLSVDLDSQVKKRLEELIPWGTGKLIIGKTIEILIAYIEQNGVGRTIADVMEDNLELRQKE